MDPRRQGFTGLGQPYKKLRRRLRAARRWTVLSGLFGGATAVLVPYAGLGGPDAIWAALTGASIGMAALRWFDYRHLSKAMPAETARLAQHGVYTLAGELNNIGEAAAGVLHRKRTETQFRRSAARGPYERLEAADRAYRGLVARLEGPAREAVDEVDDVAEQLRGLAHQVRGVERSIDVARGPQRHNLIEAHRQLVGRLESGVAAYESMVAGAAQIVAESAAMGPVVPGGEDLTVRRLTDAADRLKGFADGLGEMRDMHNGMNPTLPPQ
ncbi:phage shock envelope stress response protein PspM [Actinorhabdospora filicis]|nr:hypothetical protein [Actinorhabdospora filicis]